MERNTFGIDMNVYTFLRIKLFQKIVEFNFLKNAIIVFLSLSLVLRSVLNIYLIIVFNYYSLTP